MGTNLPPGFRFFPSDEELVVHFLHRKAALLPCHPDIIPTVDLQRFDPWDLNGKALQGGNGCWYLFARGSQDRATANGYWHAAGTAETVTSGRQRVGVKKTLRYYLGEPPDGVRTNWAMHEFHLFDGGGGGGGTGTGTGTGGSGSSSSSNRRKRGSTRTECDDKWVICRVYESGGGSQASLHDDGGAELSCLDEVFLSLDDLDEVSLPK